ncbi:hypothetical protein E2C01_048693 [Portunus trituberculatus]|uniref:Uncharacterized protein n=1 Tax=Portunus trituberculatus TaxID=210409 RepID=A0A5B7GCA9_PORTR|nr:hypothetical protein [Portunus trituberculatus]
MQKSGHGGGTLLLSASATTIPVLPATQPPN